MRPTQIKKPPSLGITPLLEDVDDEDIELIEKIRRKGKIDSETLGKASELEKDS